MQLRVLLRMVGLSLDDLTVFGIPRLQLLAYCQFIFLLTLIYFLLLSIAVPNMHGAQRDKSYFKSRNLDGGAPSFSGINMDLGWR